MALMPYWLSRCLQEFPVAAMTIGTAGAINAAVFAARIVALSDEAVRTKLAQYVNDLAAKVLN